MIAVIADDFTGAAEIGGIGLRHGLNVVIETEVIRNQNADLLVIATDTRSLNEKDAAEHISHITKELQKLKPKFIFKKVDSVLRGNITEEIIAQMEASGKNRAIIIAANPIFKRIIQYGVYYIDNTLLHETFFATDPEYPINSSVVLDILKTDKAYLVNLTPYDELPLHGLIIGDVTNCDDLDKWAALTDDTTLVAGASGFFDALLARQSILKPIISPPFIQYGQNSLYVLGSTFPKNSDFIKKLEKSGYTLSNMPREIYIHKHFDPSYLEYWVNDIVQGLNKNHKVVVSIVHPQSDEPEIASRIKNNIGQLIKKVSERIALNELIVEGGSTTYVILKYLNIKKLYPIRELDTGVIRMRIDGQQKLCLTTKPGSYCWPDNFWYPSEMLQTDTI
jgi:D-threonate/D-erythronate kinase